MNFLWSGSNNYRQYEGNLPSQIDDATPRPVVFEVPTFSVGAPARQGHWPSPILTVTPGVSHPMIFIWGGRNGEAINLTPFTIRFVVWQTPKFDITRAAGAIDFKRGQTLLLDRVLTVDDPYSGVCHTVLTGEDSELIGSFGQENGGLRWALLLQNGENIYAAEVGPNGTRSGEVSVDYASGLPPFAIIANT